MSQLSQSHKSVDFGRQRVLVTGGTGLLGSHLVKHLVERNAEVVVLVRDIVPQSLYFSDPELLRRTTMVKGELEDFRLIERIINEYEIETIFHLGAQTIVAYANASPIATFKANIEGTWNVLEAARIHKKLVKRLIIASSDKAYGNLEGKFYDELTPLRGEHPYDVSKSCADLLSRAYYKTYELPVAITRCGNFFGPGDLNYSRIIPGTIRSILFNEAPVIRSDGTLVRDYIYAKDGVHAYMSLAEQMHSGSQNWQGEAFNFSYENQLTAMQVVSAILKLMNREDLKPIVLNQANNEIPFQALNSNKARSLLDWTPQFGFEEGLSETIAWYHDRLGEAAESKTFNPSRSDFIHLSN